MTKKNRTPEVQQNPIPTSHQPPSAPHETQMQCNITTLSQTPDNTLSHSQTKHPTEQLNYLLYIKRQLAYTVDENVLWAWESVSRKEDSAYQKKTLLYQSITSALLSPSSQTMFAIQLEAQKSINIKITNLSYAFLAKLNACEDIL